MTQQEYEQKREQEWRAFCNRHGIIDRGHVILFSAFFDAFDRAYALGMKSANKQQWINVDRQLPETDSVVLVFLPARLIVDLEERYEAAYYDGEDWYTTDGKHIRPDYWMNIPPLNP